MLMDSLLDNAPCGYLAFTDDGIIRMVNHTLAELLGQTPEQLHGQRVESILTVGARIFYQTHFFPVLKLHGEAEEVYLTLRTHGGADIPVPSDDWVKFIGAGALVTSVLVHVLWFKQQVDRIPLEAID